MCRTVIDLDDETTEELMRVYNVAAAVRRAMEEAAKLHRRMAFMDAIDTGAIDFTYDARVVNAAPGTVLSDSA